MVRRLILPIYLILTGMLFLSSCYIYPSYEEIVEQRSKIKSIPFEKEKWFDKEGIGVEALWEVGGLLGEQELDKGTNSIGYQLFVEPGVVDPVYVENLEIYFDQDQKVRSAEIRIIMMDGHPDYR